MLTSLPSLLIILCTIGGKLARKRDFIRLLQWGFGCLQRAGTLFVFFQDVAAMAVSALLGIGAGLIIPLSHGIDFTVFYGEYRVRQFAIACHNQYDAGGGYGCNGYLAEVHWRLPFAVYLLPLILVFRLI